MAALIAGRTEKNFSAFVVLLTKKMRLFVVQSKQCKPLVVSFLSNSSFWRVPTRARTAEGPSLFRDSYISLVQGIANVCVPGTGGSARVRVQARPTPPPPPQVFVCRSSTYARARNEACIAEQMLLCLSSMLVYSDPCFSQGDPFAKANLA